jgi:hypothetical protein
MNTPVKVEQLASLAAGLSLDARISVEVQPGGWCWLPEQRTIRVSKIDLEVKGPEYCAGVLAHEVGHCYLSRYHLVDIPFPSRPVLSHILNGIEDPRVNTWIRRRYPGTALWFRRLSEEDAWTPFEGVLPSVLRFGLEAAREELLGWLPAIVATPVPPRVWAALESTRASRQRYAAELPSPDLLPDEDKTALEERYESGFLPRLAAPEQGPRPMAWEQTVRLSALEALIIAQRDILPAVRQLLTADLNQLGGYLGEDSSRRRQARQALSRRDEEQVNGLVADAFSHTKDLTAGPISSSLQRLALELLEAWLAARSPKGTGDGSGGTVPPGTPAPPSSPAIAQPIVYPKIREKLEGQIGTLVQRLEEVLRPRRRLRSRSGYPTGQRLDLRRAMIYEADPRQYDRLWSRPSIPSRRDTAFSLLIDLSGSMRGAKCEAAVAGTILLAETLHRLEVPFAVNGFQDVLIPVCPFGAGLGAEVREPIASIHLEISGSRPGGNNHPLHNDDGPCVLAAAEELLSWPAREHVLLVVSDGLPEGKHSGPDDLRKAVASLSRRAAGLKLVGIGLGSGTEHVKQFYPESIASVPAGELAERIGDVLRRILTGHE